MFWGGLVEIFIEGVPVHWNKEVLGSIPGALGHNNLPERHAGGFEWGVQHIYSLPVLSGNYFYGMAVLDLASTIYPFLWKDCSLDMVGVSRILAPYNFFTIFPLMTSVIMWVASSMVSVDKYTCTYLVLELICHRYLLFHPPIVYRIFDQANFYVFSCRSKYTFLNCDQVTSFMLKKLCKKT